MLTSEQQEMVLENRYLVLAVVKRIYRKSYRRNVKDLIAAGNIGLCKAVKGFKPEYGYCFSTYAFPTIQREILHYIRQDTMVHVPEYVHNNIYREEGYKNKTLPIPKEIIELGKKALQTRLFKSEENSKDWEEFHYLSYNNINVDDTFDLVEKNWNSLTDKERFVLDHHYGLHGKTRHSFREIGNLMGVTKQRTQGLHKDAIRKLQKALKVYL